MAAKSSVVKDLMAFSAMVVVIIGIGFMMRGLQSYVSGDWRVVSSCPSTYWQCRSEFSGSSLGMRGKLNFTANAKACSQMRAYDVANRRATIDCATSHSVRRNSCREVSTLCDLPNNPKYY